MTAERLDEITTTIVNSFVQMKVPRAMVEDAQGVRELRAFANELRAAEEAKDAIEWIEQHVGLDYDLYRHGDLLYRNSEKWVLRNRQTEQKYISSHIMELVGQAIKNTLGDGLFQARAGEKKEQGDE